MTTSNEPTKDLKPTITGMRKALRGIPFNPKTPGPMKIIADMADPHYYEMRSVELIFEAQKIRKHQRNYRTNTRYQECLDTAIQLLVLAKIV
ncbi:MAG: hypothetical protein QQN63_02240 [Nitrosopumilus sp.]